MIAITENTDFGARHYQPRGKFNTKFKASFDL